MPTYVYRCLECDKRFEVQQSFSDAPLSTCNCEKQAPVKKVFLPVGVTFKGSGFYKTDSRGSSGSSSSGGGESSSSDKGSSSSEKSSSEKGSSDKPAATASSSGSSGSSGSGGSSGGGAGSTSS